MPSFHRRPSGPHGTAPAVPLRFDPGAGWTRTQSKHRPSLEGRTFGRLERVVTTLVEAGLQHRDAAPPNLIERLRHLEHGVLASGGDRQVLQVIASGRCLLGDRIEPVSSDDAARIDPGEALP